MKLLELKVENHRRTTKISISLSVTNHDFTRNQIEALNEFGPCESTRCEQKEQTGPWQDGWLQSEPWWQMRQPGFEAPQQKNPTLTERPQDEKLLKDSQEKFR